MTMTGVCDLKQSVRQTAAPGCLACAEGAPVESIGVGGRETACVRRRRHTPYIAR